MKYIDEINSFYSWLETNSISTQAIVLWHALMHICNKTGWKQDFNVAISVLELKTGLSRSAIYRARNVLKQAGRIDFKARGSKQSSTYSLIPFVYLSGTQNGIQSGTDNGTHSGTHDGTDSGTQSETIPRHRLDKTNNKESKPKKQTSRFAKPSIDEVVDYCRQRNNQVDANRFVDYYDANGWRIGKNPMKDWKAAVRTWERNNYGGTNINAKSATANKPESKFRFGEG